VNIKLKRGIFQSDVWGDGALIALGLHSNIGSPNNNCFDTNLYSHIEPDINPEPKAARLHPAKASFCGEPVDLGSEWEQQA
jgi:hypothetical protein